MFKLKSLFNKFNKGNKTLNISDKDSNSVNINHENCNKPFTEEPWCKKTLNVSDKDSNSVNINHENCSYCNKPFTEEPWCKKCDPFRIIEGWTSGNNDIDKFIKDTIYDAKETVKSYGVKFLQWVPFDRFENINQIG